MSTRLPAFSNHLSLGSPFGAAEAAALAQASIEGPVAKSARDEWSEPPAQTHAAVRNLPSRMRLEIPGVMAAVARSAMGNLLALACTTPILNIMRLGTFNEFRL